MDQPRFKHIRQLFATICVRHKLSDRLDLISVDNGSGIMYKLSDFKNGESTSYLDGKAMYTFLKGMEFGFLIRKRNLSTGESVR
jgi:hypothetical protein